MDTNSDLLTNIEATALLKNILKQEKLEDGKIEIDSRANKGDGFLSSMIRVKVTGKNKSLHFIIKCAPKLEQFRLIAPISIVFKKESKWYEQVWPELIKFQEERKINDPFDNVPHCYKTVNDDMNEKIVMEDLIKGRGYELFDKRKQMKQEQATKVLQIYGKFHAISFAMQDQNKALYDKLSENMFDPMHLFHKSTLDIIALSVEQVVELFEDEKSKSILNNVAKNVEKYFKEVAEGKSKYKVINHGDCWSNNMLFKFDKRSNEIEDVKLVDFQLQRSHSPVFDLAYFLYASTGKDVFGNLDKQLTDYYQSLIKHGKALGSDITKLYPYEALKEDWILHSKFGFILACGILKVIMKDEKELIDFTDVATSKNSINDMVSTDFKGIDIINQRLRDLTTHMLSNKFLS